MTSSTPERAPAPIVFPILGLKPDVHLQVFHQAFHVHSLALKMSSEFFRKYLDSPGKVASTPPINSEFAYKWVTQIDEDGTWSLVSAETLHQTPTAKLAGSPSTHVEAFRTLLQAMYNCPIVIKSPRQLIDLAGLADYYRCLPNLSVAASASLYRSPGIMSGFPNHCLELVDVAAKLRNKILFKECLIYLVRAFHDPMYQRIRDQKLRLFAEQTHRALKSKIAEHHLSTFDVVAMHYNPNRTIESRGYADLGVSSILLAWGTKDQSRRAVLPLLFRELLKKAEPDFPAYAALLKTALQSNLKLNPSARAGEGKFEDTFLCAEISDDMLPWDVNEIAW
ncbi:hypothetical protein HYALB_00013502 [Hymenoscyphus albidus]|uniref:BTB domain-containing protein n=1 Tax=Hymenoscyphus albidus TaxID=595503 RepID=A0A9N9QA57_9HELO|nr:hypothetical protein HYALB_00013502 [Hymenoscyphus albidus]